MTLLEQALSDIQLHDVIVFDGECVLCSSFMRFVIRHDRDGHFHFIIAQSQKGEALYQHLGLKPQDYETNLVFVDGQLHERLAAFAAVMAKLGLPWRLMKVARLIPQPISDWLYNRIARNRYSIFGKYDTCIVPDAGLKARLL